MHIVAIQVNKYTCKEINRFFKSIQREDGEKEEKEGRVGITRSYDCIRIDIKYRIFQIVSLHLLVNRGVCMGHLKKQVRSCFVVFCCCFVFLQ